MSSKDRWNDHFLQMTYVNKSEFWVPMHGVNENLKGIIFLSFVFPLCVQTTRKMVNIKIKEIKSLFLCLQDIRAFGELWKLKKAKFIKTHKTDKNI